MNKIKTIVLSPSENEQRKTSQFIYAHSYFPIWNDGYFGQTY